MDSVESKGQGYVHECLQRGGECQCEGARGRSAEVRTWGFCVRHREEQDRPNQVADSIQPLSNKDSTLDVPSNLPCTQGK
jgi:hypothetical protein